jgi:hypothetical protein
MRKWISLCESADRKDDVECPYDVGAEDDAAPLDEGKVRDAALAFAASAAAMHGLSGAVEKPKEEIPSYYVYDDEANALGISDLDKVHIDDVDAPAASKPDAPAKPQGELSDQRHLSENVKLLALTIWGEARSDGPKAMEAVGHVIMNRIKSERRFGASIKEVVWKRKAFSCWNKGDPNREAMQKIGSLPTKSLDRKRWKQAIKVAQKILSGESRDPTKGALFYHTKAMGRPYWVDDSTKPVAAIDSHLFYRNDAKARG